MAYIYFNLNHSSSLQGMAPPAMPQGGFGAAALPPNMRGNAGIYIIINCNQQANNHNRYVGISGDIGDRFNTRMATVTELGISAAVMAQIYVVWGEVKYHDHPLPNIQLDQVQSIGQPGLIPFPPWGWQQWNQPLYQAPLRVVVNAGQQINLEHLLIRFVLNQMGAGGTVSNNTLRAPFTHGGFPGPPAAPAAPGAPPAAPAGQDPYIVRVSSPAFGPYAAYDNASILLPGNQW